MAKIPTILEAGRADGKLATSNSIFDEDKGMFQSEINDIQDTLNSDNPNKPLSANQGKVLKNLLDSKVIEAGSVPIDTEPIEGNITHLVNSDGLAKEFNKHNTEIILGGVYDVSSHNDNIVFESLQALLNSPNLSTLIPISVRHGGMMIRFIQGTVPNSDNKYVQYRLMSTLFSTTETNWQNVDDKLKDIEGQLTTLGSDILELEVEVGNEKDIQKIFSYADSTDDDLMFSTGANKVMASTQNYWGKVFRLQEGLQYNSNAKLYLFNHKPTVDDSDYKEVIDYSARFTANDNLWAVTVAMSPSTDIKLTTYAHGIQSKLPQIETNKQNISKISDDIMTLNDYVKDTDEKLGLLSETTDSIFMSTLERTENLCNPFKINFVSDLYSNGNKFISYNKKNTSILAIYEINGKEGDHYYFFVADELLSVGNLFVWTANEFPSPNSTILQIGSPASDRIFRGNILLNKDTKYLIAEVRFGYNTPTTDDIIEQYRYMFIHNLTICKKYIDKAIPYYKIKKVSFGDTLIKRREERTLFLNNDVLAGSSLELGSGWQGNLNALTHTSGTSPVIVNFDTVQGKKYLFCCTLGTAKEHSLFVTIGELAAVDTYNGTNTVNIGFISNGGKLKITPESSFVSTVSNIKLYEIVNDEKDSTHSVVLTSREVDGNNMPSDISGFYNVSIGDLTTLSSLINGSRNIAIGVKSLGAFTSGTRNIGVGTFTMSALKSGDHNIAIGADAFFLPEKLEDSISIGYGSSGWSGGVSFNKCVAIGTYAFSAVKGNVSESTAVGQDAMRVAQTDIKKSVAVGTHAGYYSGNNNTYIGWYAGAYTKGDNNVAIGHYTDKTYVTGSQNTFVGSLAHAGDNNASASNIETIDNAIVIGYSAIAEHSNEIVIGNRSNNKDYIIIGNKKITFNSDGSVTWSIRE